MKKKTDPIFKGLPEALKDPKNYKKTEKKLSSILKTEHHHKSVKTYMNCKECHLNFENRRKLMKEIGFKNLEQYHQWKKVMAHFLTISKKIKYEKA